LNQRAIDNREPEKATRGEAAKSLAAIYEKLGKAKRAKQIKGEGDEQ
jgi:hypothetical protein